MPINDPQPESLGLLVAVVISIVSGFISIARRIVLGHPATLLWIITEFMTAILCGYLMYQAYPKLIHILPEWFTPPIAIALAAHTGGRVFQELEGELVRKYVKLCDRRNGGTP